MLTDIKKMLMDEPQHIVTLLEEYDYRHIHPKSTEIRFARSEDGGQNISIRLKDNEGIYVKDFVTDDHQDIIGYIMKNRDVKFITVLKSIKHILNLSDDWQPPEKHALFGGFYDRMHRIIKGVETTYPEEIMDQYSPYGNKRWLRDGISLKTQEKYDVRYDVTEDLIVFPWRSATSGEIIAVKARINYPQEDDMMKYFYLTKGSGSATISNSLYGYSENYADLIGADTIMVVEGEKTVQILDEWGYKNAVAVGCHSLSDAQARLIMALNPKKVWFLMDKNLVLSETEKNIKMLKKYLIMRDIQVKYWDWTGNTTVREKGAPVDEGRAVFEEICRSQLKDG